jgi:hypothetical protein
VLYVIFFVFAKETLAEIESRERRIEKERKSVVTDFC